MSRRFAIFGNPVQHSKSPDMHNHAFRACGIDALYEKILIEDAARLKEVFLAENLQGANITVPHKEQAFCQADEVRGIAQQIGAVNTWVKEADKIIAYNTDAPGFYKAIESFGSLKSALLLGAGGTAKAIALILKEKGVDVEILNRSQKRLEEFKQRGFVVSSWERFMPKQYDLIINSTSAGLSDSNLPAPQSTMKALLEHKPNVIDCIYGKMTPFLEMAKAYHCAYKDGADMLLYQGVEAYHLFTDFSCKSEQVEDAMRKGL
jgi:shikimate dehydrogenase